LFPIMHKARRRLFIALVLGLTAISTIATVIPAYAASAPPLTYMRPDDVIHR